MTIKSEAQSKARHPIPLIVTPAQAGVQWRSPATDATGYQPALV
jgi:hypothetical protein